MSSDPAGGGLQRIAAATTLPLIDVAGTRALEAALMATVPPHTLMQRAGLAVARLTMAVAPHAQVVWLACGPGNNGGDGLEAAAQLQQHGRTTFVSWLGTPESASPDTHASWARARESGVQWVEQCPPQAQFHVDALLGIGSQARPMQERMRALLQPLNAHRAATLAVDIPTGLDADHGSVHDIASVAHACHCLTLLTLKPGLFTGHGRDLAGTVWLHDLGLATLGADVTRTYRCAELLGVPPPVAPRTHASHKGSFGDVVVLGGAAGMAGAALLAGRAALHAGAGRVYVNLVDSALSFDPNQPDLMLRPYADTPLRDACAVVGCGGGTAIAARLPEAMAHAAHLVLDADALNAIANDPTLRRLLQHRTARRPDSTVLTPHPLEAARLLGTHAAAVQRARRDAALTLARELGCAVILKGSGSIVADSSGRVGINPTGNALLATAGTGDVLAGMLGAALAQGLDAWHAAHWACYRHGELADAWSSEIPLTAAALAAACQPPQPAPGRL